MEDPERELSLGFAALLRMMDWEGGRSVRRAWAEIESHEVDLGITIWVTRVQDHLRRFVAPSDHLSVYRKILVVAIGHEVGDRRSVRDLASLLDLLDRLIRWLQGNYPIAFELIDAEVVRSVVGRWDDGRRGRNLLPPPARRTPPAARSERREHG